MSRLLKTICLLTMALPVSLEASTYISEIAWMGTSASANHEWIEIHNSSQSAIDVTGWVLSDGANLNITLSGTISPSTYAVLERSSDESAPGPAFLIYTGALVNTGATLTLRNQAGDIVDQVAGGENWQLIGGDNTTKETAQYTTKGWGTGVATPGTANVVTEKENNSPNPNPSSGVGQVVNYATTSSVVASSKANKDKSATVLLRENNSQLVLKPEFQKVAYVNQKIPFKVTASGIGKNLISSLEHTWNFGDSYKANGKEVEHYYRFPGHYVVTVYSEFADNEAVVRGEITVLPVTFSLSKSDKGDIQINNDAPYDIDISGYQLIGMGRVLMPPRTILSAKSTMTIEKERVETLPGSSIISFYDQAQNLIATLNPQVAYGLPKTDSQSVVYELPTVVASSVVVASHRPEVTTSNFNFLAKTALADVDDPNQVVDSGSQAELAEPVREAVVTPVPSRDPIWPYVLFIGLLFASLGALLYGKRVPEN